MEKESLPTLNLSLPVTTPSVRSQRENLETDQMKKNEKGSRRRINWVHRKRSEPVKVSLRTSHEMFTDCMHERTPALLTQGSVPMKKCLGEYNNFQRYWLSGMCPYPWTTMELRIQVLLTAMISSYTFPTIEIFSPLDMREEEQFQSFCHRGKAFISNQSTILLNIMGECQVLLCPDPTGDG